MESSETENGPSREREQALRLYQHQLAWTQTRLIEVRKGWGRRQAASNDAEMVLATDAMALQLRMALESMAYATLVTNEAGYTRARPTGGKDWHAARILRGIAEANPNFYPWPFTISLLPSGTHIESSLGPYLKQEQFIDAYDSLGAMLHAPNPLRVEQDYVGRAAQIARWGQLAEELVASHIVELPGHGFVIANVDRQTAVSRVQLVEPVDGLPYTFTGPGRSTRSNR